MVADCNPSSGETSFHIKLHLAMERVTGDRLICAASHRYASRMQAADCAICDLAFSRHQRPICNGGRRRIYGLLELRRKRAHARFELLQQLPVRQGFIKRQGWIAHGAMQLRDLDQLLCPWAIEIQFFSGFPFVTFGVSGVSCFLPLWPCPCATAGASAFTIGVRAVLPHRSDNGSYNAERMRSGH